MYIVERDVGVKIWDVEAIGYFDGVADSDYDGIADYDDDFPYDFAASVDTDGDEDDGNEGASDRDISGSNLILDEDDDNDGIPDVDDPNPQVPDYEAGYLANFGEAFNGAIVDAPLTYRVLRTLPQTRGLPTPMANYIPSSSRWVGA